MSSGYGSGQSQSGANHSGAPGDRSRQSSTGSGQPPSSYMDQEQWNYAASQSLLAMPPLNTPSGSTTSGSRASSLAPPRPGFQRSSAPSPSAPGGNTGGTQAQSSSAMNYTSTYPGAASYYESAANAPPSYNYPQSSGNTSYGYGQSAGCSSQAVYATPYPPTTTANVGSQKPPVPPGSLSSRHRNTKSNAGKRQYPNCNACAQACVACVLIPGIEHDLKFCYRCRQNNIDCAFRR
ncbi:hypothetical protein K491DRAFT_679218 [Lophiostoma macrostomum CBS 122681]|uniref:Uncharacterized protein n=1 Tax=Lophiostoma macrostomum CBS 122681 TaxID=1314788 RepID=A0A6A6T526_9PLEO|nr:hypothetical protein K491DRAFT_679218 [Lophiostoma macrostomum CBS 122681]